MKTLLCIAMALALTGAARAAERPTVDEVLGRMAQALGGRERLARVTSVHTRVRLEAAGLKGTAEGVVTADGRSRSSYELGGADSGLSVFDGKTAWVRDANGKVREQAGPELESEVTSAYLDSFSHLVPGRRPGRVELAGEDADRTHYLVRVVPEGGEAVTLHINEKTWLVDRAERKVGARTSVSVYDDWREVEGVKFAFKARERAEGDKLETVVTVEEVRLNAPVDETAFRKPEEGAADFKLADAAGAVGIPFELTSNHIYMQVRINGFEPLSFLFDSGAGTSVINTPRAKALGFELVGQLQARGSGEGTLDAALIKNVTLSVPGAEVSGQTIVAVPLASIEPFEGRAMDGILGYDFTSRFVVEIDYAAKRISFYDPKTYVYAGKGERIPLDLRSNVTHVRATVAEPGGEPVEGVFTLDTGSRNALSLNTPFVAKHAWASARSQKAVPAPFGIGVGGETKTRVGRVGSLRLGRYALENVLTGFETATQGGEADPNEAGNIGGEVLRRFTVVFDYSRSAMYLEPNADFSTPMEYDMLGALLKLDAATPSAFAVQRVVELSAAADAGLKPGDVIVSVDGRPSSELTLEQIRQRFRREPGHTITLGVLRGGDTQVVKVTLRRIV